jgi:hypothetical protein
MYAQNVLYFLNLCLITEVDLNADVAGGSSNPCFRRLFPLDFERAMLKHSHDSPIGTPFTLSPELDAAIVVLTGTAALGMQIN